MEKKRGKKSKKKKNWKIEKTRKRIGFISNVQEATRVTDAAAMLALLVLNFVDVFFHFTSDSLTSHNRLMSSTRLQVHTKYVYPSGTHIHAVSVRGRAISTYCYYVWKHFAQRLAHSAFTTLPREKSLVETILLSPQNGVGGENNNCIKPFLNT